MGSINFIFGDDHFLLENYTLKSIASALHLWHHLAQAWNSPDKEHRLLLHQMHHPRHWLVGFYSRGSSNRRGRPSFGIFYSKFNCMGDGANMSGRVSCACKLDEMEAKQFLNISYIDGAELLKPFDNALILY
ncbi:hypothetical protein U9M48_001920 [Paspalum notatum var. saurae]|uniref:Uncharacterized protein n=1 Tax=Paspalum notatum var. saurae TaxID=547442 RepID=A0AAQ3SJD3_PASNO